MYILDSRKHVTIKHLTPLITKNTFIQVSRYELTHNETPELPKILMKHGFLDIHRYVSRESRVHDADNPKRDAQLNDTWIAACALAYNMPLVSDNFRDFGWMQEAVGLNLICFSQKR